MGYVSTAKYAVDKIENDDKTVVTLIREQLASPYRKQWPLLDEDLDKYRRLLTQDFSFGAWDGDLLVGISVAEEYAWNRSLQIWEFHVVDSHRRLGIGRRLMDTVASRAHDANLRILVCETQNTNTPAIDFYRKVGFNVQAIDLSFYSNDDIDGGEVAIFMKRKIPDSN